MRTILDTKSKTETELEREVSGFIFSIVSGAALLIGVWGTACLVSGLMSEGFANMVKSYVTAITGM